jgi:DNA-binding winged helix-turn-helix (wHTH) protein/TolB-like protein/Tfp pilus assembly protein PilF
LPGSWDLLFFAMANCSNPVTRFYEFGNFRLDALTRTLLRDGQAVPLAPKAFEMMLALAESHEKILSKDDLMRRIWPDTIVEENNLTVIISILRKALGENPSQHRYIVTIPGRGYRFVAKVNEVAEEERAVAAAEVQRDDRVVYPVEPPAQSVFHRYAQFFRICGLVLVAGICILIGTMVLSGGRVTDARIGSIAILPFKPLASDTSEPYLGLGLADVIITHLGNLHDVIVRPTSTILRYAGLNQDPLEAGRALKVDSILDGHFQLVKDRIRLTIQVIRVRDGETLWSETFDDKFTNLFSMQDAISERVAHALMIRLKDGEKQRMKKRYTDDPEAYQLYLYGRYFWNRRTADGLRKAAAYFTQASEKDPSFALAYAGLADSYCLFDYYSVLPANQSYPKAKDAALKALSLDPGLAQPHVALGLVDVVYEWNWGEAEREYQQAIDLNPNYATAHQWYGEYLAAIGRDQESQTEMQKALNLDPLSLIGNSAAGLGFYFGHHYDQSIERIRKSLELDNDFWPAHWFLGWSLLAAHQNKDAIGHMEQARIVSGNNTRALAELGYAQAMAGNRAQARRVYEELKAESNRTYVSPFGLALIAAAMGLNNEAFNWLDRAADEHTWDIIYLNRDPKLDSLRSDPRFHALAKRVGLTL